MIYTDAARSKVRFSQTHSEEFETIVRLKQGDAFSPILIKTTPEVVVRIGYWKGNWKY